VAKAQNNLAHWEDALKIVKGMMKSTGVAGHDKAKDKVKNGFVNVEKQIADSEGKEEKDGQEKKKRKKAKKGKGKGRSTKRSMGVR
jgi:hypothetical protein